MSRLRIVLLGVAMGISCLAQVVSAAPTNVVPATSAPARGGFAILVGDVNGAQIYVPFSATTTAGGRIALPIVIDGQTSAISVMQGAGGPAVSVTTLAGSVMTLLQGSVVSIDHTVTVTGTVALAAGTFVSINHTLTVTGTVALAQDTVVSIDHTVTVTGTVELAAGTVVSIDHTVTVTGSVGLVAGTVVSIDHTLTVTGTVNTQEVPNLKVLEFSFTPLTALYQSGDLFGPVTELVNAARLSGDGFMIHSISFTDSEGNNPDITLVLSDQTFTVTGDGTPFDPDDTEVQQFIGQIKIVGVDWEAYSVNGQASKGNLGQLGIVDATSLFVALIINTNTTFAASQTFRVRIYVIQE